MDTQNVSAQLYFNQLPVDNNAGYIQSDAQIENAFQKQLNLSEIYKSPVIFDKMKREYMENYVEDTIKLQPKEVQGILDMKPIANGMATDFLYKFIKENFGKSKKMNPFAILIIIALIICILLFYFKIV